MRKTVTRGYDFNHPDESVSWTSIYAVEKAFRLDIGLTNGDNVKLNVSEYNLRSIGRKINELLAEKESK